MTNAGVGGPVRVGSATGEMLHGDGDPVLPGETLTATVEVRARESGDCQLRVIRGGSWGHNRIDLGPVPRTSMHASFRFRGQGFRVVRSD